MGVHDIFGTYTFGEMGKNIVCPLYQFFSNPPDDPYLDQIAPNCLGPFQSEAIPQHNLISNIMEASIFLMLFSIMKLNLRMCVV